MGSKFWVWAVVGLFWVTPSNVSADPITLFFSRTVTAGAQVGGQFVEDIERNADLISASATLSSGSELAAGQSSLSSQMDGHLLSGSGIATATATGLADFAVGYSSSQTFFQFSIGEPIAYDFTGAFARSVDSGGWWEAYLRQVTTPFSYSPVFDYRELGPGTPRERGVLSPGVYEFLVLGRASAGCGGFIEPCIGREGLTSFSFSLQLTPATDPAPVPEPGTMLLLGSGLSAVVLARRRRPPTCSSF